MKALALAALVLALAGCGSEDASDSSGGASLEVSETEFALDPSSLTVDQAGEVTIRVVNDGEIEHALELELEGEGVEEETGTLAAGESAELTVDLAAGSYTMYCPIGNHREQGMEGTVVVAGGAGGAGTGATTTGEDDEDGYGYGRG